MINLLTLTFCDITLKFAAHNVRGDSLTTYAIYSVYQKVLNPFKFKLALR